MEKSAVRWILDIVKTVVIAILCSMIFVLIFALIVKSTDINETGIAYANQGIKIVSVLIGTLVGFRRGGEAGWLKGLIAGLLYIFFSFLVFSLISGELSWNNLSWIDFVTSAAVGVICGVIAVNVKKSPKIA